MILYLLSFLRWLDFVSYVKPASSEHHHCEKVSLTHLTFADYLLIFCAYYESSLNFINETLWKFSELSRLFANLEKSYIFVMEVNSEEASRLAASLGLTLMLWRKKMDNTSH